MKPVNLKIRGLKGLRSLSRFCSHQLLSTFLDEKFSRKLRLSNFSFCIGRKNSRIYFKRRG